VNVASALARLALSLALATVASVAAAQEMPKLKPGLWEIVRKSERAGEPGQRTVVCTDEVVQRQMWDIGLGTMRGACSKSELRIAGGRGTGDFVCSMGGSTTRTKAQIVFTGETGYRIHADTTYQPPLNGQARARSIIEARHLGACKSGQQPGDILLPNGTTINLRNALGGTRK
jgi:hypothetical protein